MENKTLADLAISDNGFIFDPMAGSTYSVNLTGLCVLQAMKDGLSKAAIVERLRERFAKPAGDLARDVDEFLQLLRQHQLVGRDFMGGE